MKVTINDYRGWEISFDTDKETFYAQSDDYDYGQPKKSFAAAKQFVDDFIKENQQFKPVVVEMKHWGAIKRIKLIGLRKDGRFIYEEAGQKKQLGQYEEGDCYLVNEDNQPIYTEISRVEAAIEVLKTELNDLQKAVVKVPIATIRDKYAK